MKLTSEAHNRVCLYPIKVKPIKPHAWKPTLNTNNTHPEHSPGNYRLVLYTISAVISSVAIVLASYKTIAVLLLRSTSLHLLF